MPELILYQSPNVCDLLPVCFDLAPDERDQYEALFGKPYVPEEVAATLCLQEGPSWFVSLNDQPLAAAGFTMIRPKVYDCWMLATPAVWAHHKVLTAYVDQAMSAMLETGTAHRLQCIALASRLRAHAWYQRCIGLAPEGTLRGYGCRGEDAILFSRVKAIH